MQDKDGQLCGVLVRDKLSKRTSEVYARQVRFSLWASSFRCSAMATLAQFAEPQSIGRQASNSGTIMQCSQC